MTLILSGTDGLSDVDGSAATPAIRGTDTNTGIFFPAADTIAFSEGGVESMRLDSSGNVNVTAGRIRLGGGSDEGTQLNLWTTVGGDGTLAAFNILFNTGANNSRTEQARITSAGLFQFNSGYGSVATAYGCRAWVNFNGTGTVAIRSSGNVTSITDNGIGDYTVNFTTAMPDSNYSATVTPSSNSAAGISMTYLQTLSTGSVRVNAGYQPYGSAGFYDCATVCVSVFR